MKPWDLDQRIRPVHQPPPRIDRIAPIAGTGGVVILQVNTSAGLVDVPLDPERALALADGIKAAVLAATGRGRAQGGREPDAEA